MIQSPKSDLRPDDLKPTVENLLRLAKHYGAHKAEAVGAHGRSLSIGVRGGVLEDIDNSEGRDIGLRVFVGQRQACVSSSDLSQTSLDKLAERAVAMAKLAPEDPYCGLANKDKLATKAPELEIFDPVDLDADMLLGRAKILEATALGVKGVNQAEGANAYMTKGASWLATSDGFDNGWQSSSHGLSVAAFANNSAGMERDYDYKTTRWLADLPSPETIGISAGERAVARLGATKMASTNLPVLFERRVAGSLLASFISAISGPAIARGVSFLKDHMGEQVFHKDITITDDPYLKRGVGSHPWDGEGVAGPALDLVENGVLKSWILNTATANQLGLVTTGHAHRGMSSPPGVSSTNAWITAGKKSPEALMQDIGKGLLITEMFGPSLNPNTGDYSVGIAGFTIEGGQRGAPVSEVTIAGNLLDMFKTMIVANDLELDEGVSSPTMLIENMVVAGA
ncbi:MAG: TldD/PmbA family protein [Robiginitomaculum sp.]|nr:TldD/PmbA family protein [Robiginitomaculum sp.]